MATRPSHHGADDDREARFGFLDGVPAWVVPMAELETLQGATCHVEHSVFALPTAALLALCLVLRNEGSEPVRVQHLFDLSTEADTAILQAMIDQGALRLVLEDAQAQSLDMLLTVEPAPLRDAVRRGSAHARTLPRLDASAAAERFVRVYSEALASSGDHASAWQAVHAASASTPPVVAAPTVSAHVTAAAGGGAIRTPFGWVATSLQWIARIPVVGPWVVALLAPVIIGLLLRSVGLDKDTVRPDLASVILGALITGWTGWLHGMGIVRLNMPLVPIPIWAIAMVMTLGALGNWLF